MVHVLLKPGLENFEYYFTSVKMSAIVRQCEHSLALPFFGTGMKTDRFQSESIFSDFKHWNLFNGTGYGFLGHIPRALEKNVYPMTVGQWSMHTTQARVVAFIQAFYILSSSWLLVP